MAKTFVRVEGIEGAPMRDESILYIPSAECYCVLNPSASAMWEAMATPKAEEELVALLCEHFDGATPETALSDVRVALAEMAKMSIVQEAS